MSLFNQSPSQTGFNDQERFNESETPIYHDEPEIAEAPKSKKKLYIFAGVGGFIVLLIILSVIIIMNREVLPADDDVVEVPAETIPLSSDKVTREIQELKAELELADPSIQIFTFPPVAATVRIDPKPRN